MNGSGRKRVGLLGWPLRHSLSPRIHEYWMREQGWEEGRYELLPVPPKGLSARLRRMPDEGFVGCNVTVPHKERVFGLLRRFGGILDETARRLGAVNTLVWEKDGTPRGSNSDGYGFVSSMTERVPGWEQGFEKGSAMVVLGAGGAARSIAAALCDVSGEAELRIVNRTRIRAEKLVRELRLERCRVFGATADELREALDGARLVVNATSIGMRGGRSWQEGYGVSAAELLAPAASGAVVCDIVYAPLQTELLAAAAERSLVCVDGLGMLLHQAAPPFAAWFGVEAAVTPELRAHVEAGLEG